MPSVLCRECHQSVSATDATCSHCGATDPARVPLTGCVVAYAIGALGLIGLLLLLFR
jgi:hypothetical protein